MGKGVSVSYCLITNHLKISSLQHQSFLFIFHKPVGQLGASRWTQWLCSRLG